MLPQPSCRLPWTLTVGGLVKTPKTYAVEPFGKLRWIPTEAQGPMTCDVTTVVTDGLASTSVDTHIVVTEVSVHMAGADGMTGDFRDGDIRPANVVSPVTRSDQAGNPVFRQTVSAKHPAIQFHCDFFLPDSLIGDVLIQNFSGW